MVWPEIEKAQNEKRRELTLNGPEISKRINKDGLDLEIFKLTDLNYLNINNTNLGSVPEDVGQLKNLQTLVLHSNKLCEVCLPDNGKLKTLDLSRNDLEGVDCGNLELVTVNLSFNKLAEFACNSESLAVLDLSYNQLKKFPELRSRNLAELNLSSNEIETIPAAVRELTGLKTLNMNKNKLKQIAGDLTLCNKLKDVNFKDNPISDKKLLKTINQGRSKLILEYLKQNCPVTPETNKNPLKSNETTEETNDEKQCLYSVTVKHSSDDSIKIAIKDDVKTVRPHIVACLIHGVTFTEEKFKKFIQMQCKLHDGICDKRLSATIATHDANKLVLCGSCFRFLLLYSHANVLQAIGDLIYTAMPPKELKLQPLNRSEALTGAELFAKLQAEANALRKEKKRNTYSGIHKYLHMLEGQAKFPCLIDASNRVISFPPITNSEVSKVRARKQKQIACLKFLF